MSSAQFHIYIPGDFKQYLLNTNFSRAIKFIQNHHTFRPDYSSLTPTRGEMFWLESMRNSHINERNWRDIGQNITTFPSGNIALCRPIDQTPAGIFGANIGAICIENFGFFDNGKDAMTDLHKQTIIILNAILCIKFNLQPVKSQVVYHHWFDTTGKRFPEDKVNQNRVGTEQKTCPGTAFFGGNTIISAEQNFYPLIVSKITELKNENPVVQSTKKVNSAVLNVRNGPGKSFKVLRTMVQGTEVSIFLERTDGWSKISNTAEEWVFSSLLA